MKEFPEWATVGAAVIEYDYSDHAALTTIERVTKTQLHLANGSVYRRSQYGNGTSRRSGGSGFGGSTYELTPLGDDKGERMLARATRKREQLQIDTWLYAAQKVAAKDPRQAITVMDQAYVLLSKHAADGEQ